MAAATLAAAPHLDLTIPGSAEDDRPSIVKETSTVGDLISFTDRRISPVRQVRRRKSTGNADPTPFRRKSLQRSDSERSLFSYRSRNSSSSTPFGENSCFSPDDEPDSSRNPTSRRNSMLSVLREDLSKIPCLKALKKHSPKASITEEDDEIFDNSDTDEERFSPRRRRTSRRASSIYRRDSRLSMSSTESFHGGLTEAELRKIKMLETLNKMDGQMRQHKRNPSIDSQTGELAILEASFGRGKKRGSIATHVLMKTRKRRSPLIETVKNRSDIIIGVSTPPEKSESEVVAEEQKQTASKMFQLLKKSEKPKLVGLVGKHKDSLTKDDIAKESILTFRRKLRRKKVNFLQLFLAHILLIEKEK